MTKAKPLPPLELVQQLLDYDENKGCLIWKNPLYRTVKRGSIAGALNSRGYIQVKIAGTLYMAHRLIWLYKTGQDPASLQIDHVDGNRSNNCFANLRLATSEENARNRKGHKNSKVKLKGVSYDKNNKAYCACICVNRRQINLGRFPTPELAHMAYCEAAAELHGDFARAR
jgi:hypothetical protein